MRKLLFFTTILLLGFTACSREDITTEFPDDVTNGIVINGVRWATRNVDTPGTFTNSPEAFGRHFQWNIRQGFAINDDAADWKYSNFTGTEWYAENDPCPSGWRVPTVIEFQSLLNANSRWVTTREGITGRLFGNAPNQIFLPAVGIRFPEVTWLGSSGFYWSNTQHSREYSDEFAMSFVFGDDIVYIRSDLQFAGFPIRCVTINK